TWAVVGTVRTRSPSRTVSPTTGRVSVDAEPAVESAAVSALASLSLQPVAPSSSEAASARAGTVCARWIMGRRVGDDGSGVVSKGRCVTRAEGRNAGREIIDNLGRAMVARNQWR